MKVRTSFKEMNALCCMLIEDFLRRYHYSNTRVIDIENFATEYLGTKIVYEVFAEGCPGRGGFISDGKKPLQVLRNGIFQKVIFPENVIVIDSSLTKPEELARMRFTIAHETAHLILKKHVPGNYAAAYHTEFVSGESYEPEMIINMLSYTETLMNKAAASLLMPDFIIDRALKTYNNGNKIIVYRGSDTVVPDSGKMIIQRMADSMGVSFKACYHRLQELSLFEEHPLIEYAALFRATENDNV